MFTLIEKHLQRVLEKGYRSSDGCCYWSTTGLVSGAMPELPDVTGGAIPSAPAPTQTGPALPF